MSTATPPTPPSRSRAAAAAPAPDVRAQVRNRIARVAPPREASGGASRGRDVGGPAPATSVADTVLPGLESAAWKWKFFGALRALECHFSDRARTGCSGSVTDDPVRLSQTIDLAFRASPFSKMEPPTGRSPRRLFMNCFGLHGPEGPMPLWMTHFLMRLDRQEGDLAAARFVDVFNHRMTSLLYRAWASSMQTVSYDRARKPRPLYEGNRADALAEDDFAQRFAGLTSVLPALRDQRWSVTPVARLFYSGWFVQQARCAEGLVAIVSDYFDLPCTIEEFVGQRIDLAPGRQSGSRKSGRTYGGVACDRDPTRLAHLMPATPAAQRYGWRMGNTLGRGAILGGSVYTCQNAFRLVLGPMSLEQYERMLPDGRSARRLAEWVVSYAGEEFDWEALLVLDKHEVPEAALDGRRRLGMTTWLPGRDRRDRSDLVIRASAATRALYKDHAAAAASWT